MGDLGGSKVSTGTPLIISAHCIKTHCVMWPKKPACHTVSILTGRAIRQFSHLRNFVLLI